MSTALLIIDVQRAFFDGIERQPAFEAKEVIERLNGVSERARKAGVPVIFVQHESADQLKCGSDAWQLATGLQTAEGDLFVRKMTPDSFLRTDLQRHLEQRGVRQLVVCGFATESCIDSTFRRAAGLGYDLVLLNDGHTTHDKPHADGAFIRAHHNYTLMTLKSFGVALETRRCEEQCFE